MARNQKERRRPGSSETTELGKVLYICQKQPVVSLVANDIPYPNSPVLDEAQRVIGKVDEILGRLDDVYVAIKLNDDERSCRSGEMLFSYVDKFIPKRRFLPRSETEKRKEEMDLAKAKARRGEKGGAQKRDEKPGGTRNGSRWNDKKSSSWKPKSNNRNEWSGGKQGGSKCAGRDRGFHKRRG